ncbi:YifB family Mg chelatase-like AAA ATPase [Ilumatobacter sp.]|uniref:YifB family Mg chelatase-like AAA ATPase n=1 Tax=Ilumatobacter sp. TaxID=1967498 RepID=UPI003B5195A8
MFASVPSAVILGAEGQAVSVEVHVGKGLPGFHMVGLPDESVRESRDRVRAAVMSCGASWPDVKVTVNLAPSQHRKSGSGLDLAIALGVLAADEQIPIESLRGCAFIGELGLDGTVRPVTGVAPMVGALADPGRPDGVDVVVVPVANAHEASVVSSGRVRPAGDLAEVIAVHRDLAPWPDHDIPAPVPDDAPIPDLADVQGQPLARGALEIAAAGGHHCLFVGPPGAGKTMLASRLPGLLPELDRDSALEVTMIHSAAGIELPAAGLVTRPPFRAPHHTSSEVSIVGGGSRGLRPGEISIAHCGVLFMDELPEFAPKVIQTIRQPIEEGVVRVARAAAHATIPARFQLVAAMNPCPCGGGARPGECACGEHRVERYAGRVSGPLLDRLDLRVRVERPSVDDLLDTRPGERTEVVARRVAAVRSGSVRRQGALNAQLSARDLDELAPLTSGARTLLRAEIEAERLSARGYHRVRRVARTIADLAVATADASAGGSVEEATSIDEATVALALEMRTSLRRRRPRWVA